MKKHVVIMIGFVVIGLAASAQTEQGNWLVGGNINLNTAKNYTQVTLAPSAGYFFINNFAAGGNVNFSYSKTGETKNTTFGAGPFARFYFGTLNIRPFAHADVNFLSTKSKVPTPTGGSTSNTENGSNFFLGGGLAAFINNNVAIEGLAGYSRTKFKDQDGSGGFNLRIGFQVYLSRRQVERLTQ